MMVSTRTRSVAQQALSEAGQFGQAVLHRCVNFSRPDRFSSTHSLSSSGQATGRRRNPVTAPIIIAALVILGGCGANDAPSSRQAGGDAARGKMLVAKVGCTVCHVVPQVPGPRGRVGPTLERFATRTFISGVVPNQPDMLMQFVRDAPALNPRTAMPPLPLDEGQARDIAAFLYTLR